MANVLYLASSSKSRQLLLKQASIDYKLIDQNANEDLIPKTLPLEDVVKKIAQLKMDHVILPEGTAQGEICYVLTADTMGLNSLGQICAKPKDKQHAIAMIKSYRNGATTGSAFCLEKKAWKNNGWKTQEKIIEYVQANYIFDVPDNWIERYFKLSIDAGINYLNVSGAVAIEEFGAQFVKTISGSYTTVIGLPMYELRNALERLDFF